MKPQIKITVLKCIPDIVKNPAVIATLKDGQRVLFKGVECIVQTGITDPCPIFTPSSIWFTTASSDADTYNRLNDLHDEQNGFCYTDRAPVYSQYIKHVRIPNRHIDPSLPEPDVCKRSVNSRETFMRHIADCEIN